MFRAMTIKLNLWVVIFYFQFQFWRTCLTHSFALCTGSFMVQCSEVETKLGQADKQFQDKVQAEFITPLKAFLEVDIKAAGVRR